MAELGLVVDIGRVSVRFGLTGGDAGLAPRQVRSYQVAEHATFTGALLDYVRAVGLESQPLPSVLAVAGVARGDVVNITGSRWFISVKGVEAMLRGRCRAINDFTANAYALQALAPSAFAPLPGPPAKGIAPGGKYVLVGPGSGLGVAGLVTTSSGALEAIESEAGHIALAVETPGEAKCRDLLVARRLPTPAEALLSAKGLCLAYEALAGRTVADITPEQVTRTADRDPIAGAAVQLVAGYLGAFVGDMVLAFGAWDGAILTGAVTRALKPALARPEFRQRFEAKGNLRRRLADVPVTVVQQTDLELLGAAAALRAGGR